MSLTARGKKALCSLEVPQQILGYLLPARWQQGEQAVAGWVAVF